MESGRTISICVAFLVGVVIPASDSGAANRIIGAQAPNGNAFLVKRFAVAAGTSVVGLTLQSNDATTVFPFVRILRGPLDTLSEGVTLAEYLNVPAGEQGLVRLATDGIECDRLQDLYVVVALPPSDGVLRAGFGAGIRATQLKSPAGSYFVDGMDEALGSMDVEYEVGLLFAKAEKSLHTSDAIATPAVRVQPNPFNPSVRLEFRVPHPAHVDVGVYDVTGQLICILVQETLEAGVHQRTWTGRDSAGRQVSGGVYVARVSIGGHVFSEKLILTK